MTQYVLLFSCDTEAQELLFFLETLKLLPVLFLVVVFCKIDIMAHFYVLEILFTWIQSVVSLISG